MNAVTTTRTARRLVASAVAGLLLTGVGATAALAAPTAHPTAGPTASPSAGHGNAQSAKTGKAQLGDADLDLHYWDFENGTPHTWTLDTANTSDQFRHFRDGAWIMENANWPNGAPPRTVKPGERFAVNRDPGRSSTYNDSGEGAEEQTVSYTFTDGNGHDHMVQFHASWSSDLTAYSNDCVSGNTGCQDSTKYFKMYDNDTGGIMHKVIGVIARLNGTQTVDVDAVKQPELAAAAMRLFPDSTQQSFDHLSVPFWTQTNPAPGSAKVINYTSSPVKLVSSQGTTNSESTSLSTELSWKTKLEVLGFANTSVGASIEGGHEWSTSKTVDDGTDMMIEPGKMGWLVKTNQVQNVTGNFNFVDKYGVNYHVHNVTVSMPGIAKPKPGGIPVPGTAFTPTYAPAPTEPVIG